MDTDNKVMEIIREAKSKLDKVLHDHKKVSIETKIQKEFNIPLEDVKNIMGEMRL